MDIYTITLTNKQTGQDISRDYDEQLFEDGHLELTMLKMKASLDNSKDNKF